ncbi:MAG: DUF1449 family protein [Cyanobacterium sp. T60_A2020_053]|nr:DUF1449 family protein [Cyanobacterium sp. T60_A2020_053]
MLFDIANLIYWIFLGIGIFLFLLVIFTGGGEDEDIDIDGDVESDMEVDIDGDVDGGLESNFLFFLSWLGVGKSPLIILLAMDFCAWGVSGWLMNVLVGGVTGALPTGIPAMIIFIFSFLFSVWLGRVLSIPIGKIFANFGEEIDGDRLIGCVGQVTSTKLPYLKDDKVAQADIIDNMGNLVTVEVCLPGWALVIPHRGQEVIIIDRQDHFYLAIGKDTSDQDKWLNEING